MHRRRAGRARVRRRTTPSCARGSERSPRCVQDEPHAAHGPDQWSPELAAQVADVDVDDVGGPLVVGIPDVIEQPRAADQLARMAGEVLEDRELASGQLDRGPADGDQVPGRVDDKLADAQLRRALGGPAADQRAYAREQLPEVERLGQVVVGAGVEPADAIADPDARGEHEYGHAVATPA